MRNDGRKLWGEGVSRGEIAEIKRLGRFVYRNSKIPRVLRGGGGGKKRAKGSILRFGRKADG